MGVDLRYGRIEYPDTYYYYDFNAVKNNKLIPETKPLGRIYAKSDFAWRPIVINGNITSNLEYTSIIETTAKCDDLRPSMFLLNANTRQLFIVVSIPLEANEDRSAVASTRPLLTKRIEIRGIN